MAAMFLAKRGTLLCRGYNNTARSVSDGLITTTSSRYFASHGNNGKDKSEEEGMGTTTDGKAPNVTMSHAADKAKDGMKQALDEAIKESGDASKPEDAENDERNEDNVAVGDDGTVQGQNQSSGW